LNELRHTLDSILNRAWNNLNEDRQLSSSRVIAKNKLDMGYFDTSLENLTRLEISWLVDGANPNPIYFKSPRVEDLIPHFENSTISVYNGIPLISQFVKITAYNSSYDDLLKFALLSAWIKANPQLKDNIFYVSVENSDDSTIFGLKHDNGVLFKPQKRRDVKISLSKTDSSTIVKYFVGVNEGDFDVSEIQKPSLRIIQAEIKQHVPGVMFDDDLTESGKASNKDLNRKNVDIAVRAFYVLRILVVSLFFNYIFCHFLE
jgi:hypothetical protein